ncbi:MAG TPA: exosortase system-associated protein, TIGR04073 family [Candidatus Acidoferrales bacterium]|nr:exosortase system-associated protein, TIGR04073 family [Candidatus Acidoferrales bacterium]
MRNALFLLGAVALAAAFTSGCAGPEQKLGRGISNSAEIIRGGEWRRSVEQTAVFDSPEAGRTVGFVSGFNRTMARTGVGLYEIVTFPFPPYHPIFTSYLSPHPAFPDNYRPGLPDDPLYDTHTYVGIQGGDIAPLIPGSRFQVIDN